MLHPDPTLEQLAAKAVESHAAVRGAYLSALKHARAAGNYINRCKAKVEKGKWMAWADANIAIAPSTRNLYQLIADGWSKLEVLSDDLEAETVAGARRLLTNLERRAKDNSQPPVENGPAKVVNDKAPTATAPNLAELAAGLPDAYVAEDDPDAFVVRAEQVIRDINPANIPTNRRDTLVADLRNLQAAVTEALAKLGA
jgi:hypothetical protein